ncbi:DsbA family oxidoreductase [Vibrio coralliilyticus]|uniref:DsbA family oxidoreductase n=1 Tax=Vibrio coralliilyticus TaxID=190893 RepID=UPI00148C826D|nr:DsbA family protein [Vibrio coralliilyticus]NOI30433.1 thioredoxin domain-containing protein [Vibrio coralliilyticus]NOI50021.1 thioredoxin domain-containing protein [Vibrio coralliilyticus]
MTIHIEFFHDVVCGWCYIQSSVLRQLEKKYPLKITHRSYVLQRTPQDMAERFGSLAQAKQEILAHWASCERFEGSTDRFNIEAMAKASFSYPSGLLAAQATQAAEQLAGENGHWDMFDALQRAHLQRAENIADIDVLLNIARTLGYDTDAFLEVMYAPTTFARLDTDRQRAQALDIRSIPTFIVNGQELVRQTTRYDDLDRFFTSLL